MSLKFEGVTIPPNPSNQPLTVTIGRLPTQSSSKGCCRYKVPLAMRGWCPNSQTTISQCKPIFGSVLLKDSPPNRQKPASHKFLSFCCSPDPVSQPPFQSSTSLHAVQSSARYPSVIPVKANSAPGTAHNLPAVPFIRAASFPLLLLAFPGKGTKAALKAYKGAGKRRGGGDGLCKHFGDLFHIFPVAVPSLPWNAGTRVVHNYCTTLQELFIYNDIHTFL